MPLCAKHQHQKRYKIFNLNFVKDYFVKFNIKIKILKI